MPVRPHRLVVLLVASAFACLLGVRDARAGMEVRGVSLAHLHRPDLGYGSDACRAQLARVRAIGGNWVAVMDFAYMDRVDAPAVIVGADPTLRDRHVRQIVTDAHAEGLKVLVKPHVWSDQFWNNFRWHGDIRMASEADWDRWFAAYGAYVVGQARLAQATGADGFCLGNELQGTADQEARWRALIADVRAAYTGPVTYAAAYGEWPNARWYDALDCVGINAYFPLTGAEDAAADDLRRGWRAVFDKIEPYQRAWGKPVCFTEIGYTRSAKAGVEPWAYDFSVSDDAGYQARLYRVAMEEIDRRPYMVGAFAWKWFTADDYRAAGERDPFPIQDRQPVLDALTRIWTRR